MMAHRAIRRGSEILFVAMREMHRRAKEGKTLQPFEIQALKDFAEVYGIFLHIHHDGEEHYFFPFINEALERVAKEKGSPAETIPARMAKDHESLVQNLDKFLNGVRGLSDVSGADKQAQALEAIMTHFVAASKEMFAHLKEEEEIVLPLMRRTVTQEQLS